MLRYKMPLIRACVRVSTADHGGSGASVKAPDSRFLRSPVDSFAGKWMAPGAQTLAFDTFSVSNRWLRLPAEGLTLTVTNDITLTGSEARLDLGANSMLTNLYVYGDDWGTRILMSDMSTGPSLLCGGDVTLTNGSYLFVYAGRTNGSFTG
jgi:hypothetical protein